jgi:hypothetical protein
VRSNSRGTTLPPIEFRPVSIHPAIPVGQATELDHHQGMLAFNAAVQQLDTYQPHCLIAWREQVAGMDEMGGIT